MGVRGRPLSAEHRANISAANKGRKLTVMDRVRRSYTAIEQERAEKLNARIAADPELVRARRERWQRIAAATNAKRWGKPAPEASRSDVDHQPAKGLRTDLRGTRDGESRPSLSGDAAL